MAGRFESMLGVSLAFFGVFTVVSRDRPAEIFNHVREAFERRLSVR